MTIHAGVTVLAGAISAGVALLGSVSYSSFHDGENSRQIKVNAEHIHQLELNTKDIATTLHKIEIDTAVSREKAEWLYDNATQP
ncbi:hypothetical protein [Photobacterium indicum]|uniref:TMhelix containing protein n=1 Tax=Photobacterium indicum TaxID=81447 RepID=A0A2T3LAG4_9GAMM|nr:hypothetical protein [Photobacterium indicum]PSV48302.1 hypothetical protein C9J47_07180 [Photobacterium indicum]